MVTVFNKLDDMLKCMLKTAMSKHFL